MDEPKSDGESKSDAPAASGASVIASVERRAGGGARVSLPEPEESPLTGPSSEPTEFIPHKRGDYHVLGEIARGGMGRILRAHDGDLGRDVAIKVLDPDLADRVDVLRRFVEEAQIGGQLQHPGIVPVYELGLMADERPYFTMKLVKGRTLAELFSSRRSANDDRGHLLRVFESICQTVAYAHTKGVVHRDLKPANVMVGAFGEVQVVDWGLAKVLRRGGVDDEVRARRDDLTVIETVRSGPAAQGSNSMAGSVLGTPAYMPPEQARGEVDALDQRADVFSLGAILCELLTGQPPYVEREGQPVLLQAAEAKLDTARERLDASDADPGLVDLARSCLAPAPQSRPRNGETVARAIRDHLAETEERVRRAELDAVEAQVKAGEERKARRLTIALAATALAATVAIAGGWALRAERERADVERVQGGLDEVRERVRGLLAEEQSAEAVEVARAALLLVEGRPAGDGLRQRAESLVAEVEEDDRRTRQERERSIRDARLLRRLDELRVDASVPLSDQQHVALDGEFGRAFRDWELDVDADVLESLDRLRASGMELELALALDDWASVRRWARGWESDDAARLNELAIDLDPDDVRVALRLALMERDVSAVLEIADDEGVDDLPPSTLWVLGSTLRSFLQLEKSLALLLRATSRHPDDVPLRVALAATAVSEKLWVLAARHLEIAAALRPDHLELAYRQADSLVRAGCIPAAQRVYERITARVPDDVNGLEGLAWTRFQLGDPEGARSSWDRLAELRPLQGDELVVRAASELLTGRIGGAEFERRLRAIVEDDSEAGNAAAWAALQFADEPGRVALAAELAKRSSRRVFGALEARLLLARGDPEAVMAAFERSWDPVGSPADPLNAAMLQFLRARALAALGRGTEAREALTAGRMVFEQLRRAEPHGWERSRFLTELREAERAVGD